MTAPSKMNIGQLENECERLRHIWCEQLCDAKRGSHTLSCMWLAQVQILRNRKKNMLEAIRLTRKSMRAAGWKGGGRVSK